MQGKSGCGVSAVALAVGLAVAHVVAVEMGWSFLVMGLILTLWFMAAVIALNVLMEQVELRLIRAVKRLQTDLDSLHLKVDNLLIDGEGRGRYKEDDRRGGSNKPIHDETDGHHDDPLARAKGPTTEAQREGPATGNSQAGRVQKPTATKGRQSCLVPKAAQVATTREGERE